MCIRDRSKPAITIQVEGDEWIPEIDRSEKPAHNITLSKEEIVKAIAAAGIVEMCIRDRSQCQHRPKNKKRNGDRPNRSL